MNRDEESRAQSPAVRQASRTVLWTAAFFAVAAVAVAVSFYTTRPKETPPMPPPPPPPAAGPSSPQLPEVPAGQPAATPEQAPGGSRLRIATDKGDILIELFDKETPITAGNFLLLAKSGYYDRIKFHRVEPDFCVQGGDPKGNGSGGPGFTIPDETRPQFKHDKGMLSMAKTSAPNSGGSQFFICTGGPQSVGHLDGVHTVFGKVLEGMDVVYKIQAGDVMNKVTVEQESSDAAAAEKAAKEARVPE